MAWVTGRQALRAVAVDFEDVFATIVGGGVKLLSQPGDLNLALEEIELRLGYHRLQIASPVLESTHDTVVLFVRVDWARVRFVVVFDGSVGIQSSL